MTGLLAALRTFLRGQARGVPSRRPATLVGGHANGATPMLATVWLPAKRVISAPFLLAACGLLLVFGAAPAFAVSDEEGPPRLQKLQVPGERRIIHPTRTSLEVFVEPVGADTTSTVEYSASESGPWTPVVSETCPGQNKGAFVHNCELVAQNGAQITQTTKIAVTGCPKARHAKHKRKKHARKGKKK